MIALLLASLAPAVEICDDALDDDLDGVADCADPDCASSLPCCAGGLGDVDADGWCDAVDVCVFQADTQLDADGDGAGDACDVCAGPGTGLSAWHAAALSPGSTADAGDLDADGLPELVTAGSGQVFVHTNLGAGRFDAPRALPGWLADVATIVVADVDGDGDLDVTGAGLYTDVAWWENLGGGAFALPVTVAEDVYQRALTVADLDGDGDGDAIWSGGMFWAQNLGAGGFAAQATLWDDGDVVYDLATADLDGDADADVVGVKAYDLVWWENLGGAALAPPTVIAPDADVYGAFDLGDFDDDGTLDVIAEIADALVWIPNLGGGTFGSPMPAGPGDTRSIAVGDVDADGRIDAIVGHGDETLMAYRNAGDGTFEPGEPIGLGSGLWFASLTAADLDGFEGADVVVGGLAPTVWFNTSSCSALDTDVDGLTDAAELLVFGTDPAVPDGDPASLDYDGDGVPSDLDGCPLDPDPGQLDADLDAVGDPCDACTGADSSGDTDLDGVCDDLDLCRLVSDPAQADGDADGYGDACDACPGVDGDGLNRFGEYQDRFVPGDVDAGTDVALGDLDADGDLDFVYGVVNYSYYGYDEDRRWLEWAENLGTGATAAPVVLGPVVEGANDLHVAVGDADGDGISDAFSANAEGIRFFPGQAGGPTGSIVVSAYVTGTVDLVAADLDADPEVELVAVHDGSIFWFDHSGGAFPIAGLSAVGTSDARILAEDLDGDGDRDLVHSALDDGSVGWLENLGGLTFAARQILVADIPIYLGFNLPIPIDAADLDGDGDTDLVLGVIEDDAVEWAENLGGGVFAPRAILSVALPSAHGVTAVDLDLDGDTDLVAEGYLDTMYLDNLGGGSFAPGVFLVTEEYLTADIVAGDLDGDGDPELVSTSGGRPVIWLANHHECADRDADGDGLADVAEWQVHRTRSDVADTDGDGLDDGAEVLAGLDPLGFDDDADDDGVLNLADLCPLVADPSQDDVDADGIGDACDDCVDADADGVCEPEPAEPPVVDTGIPPTDTGSAPEPPVDDPEDPEDPQDPAPVADDPKGCGCRTAPGAAGWWLALAGFAGFARARSGRR